MIIRVALLCLVGTLLSACGGGGGGGGGGGNNQPPPFVLTEANAVQAAAYALAPLEHMFPAGSLAISGAAQLRAFGSPQSTISFCGATPITASFADRDASGNLSVGDVVDIVGVNCSGFPRKLSLTLTQINTTFDQYAGRVELETEVDPSGMQVVGSFDISLNFSFPTSEATWRITNAVVTVTQTSTAQTARVTSAQFTSTPAGYSLSIAGGSVDSAHLGGAYTFATTTPLSGATRRLPSAGELMLNTSGGSRARIVPPATPGTVEETVEYAVAATSSGAFAPTQQTLWTTIIRGPLFGWRPNVAPTLTSLSIQPPNPSPGASLWVNYLAQDANGDALQTTIEWRRNGTVVGDNNQSLYINPARGDQISVTVTVSDGRLTATATTSITIGNPPPILTLTLTPAEPDTSVDIVAVPNVFEPDGDSVTLTYEWRRNGTVINNPNATLSASHTTRGDTISVRVTASDGASTVEATASVTIVDSPPRVSVVSPPTTVAHGTPVTFTATVSDADGDPVVGQFEFLLAYGPAGMTVDADTGVVSWTPSGPMFDRTMDVSWGITVDDSSAEPGTGTITVTDSSRDYPLFRSGMQIPTWPAGLSVGDFDDDDDTEMLVMAQRWLFELEADGAGGYRQAWAYPYALHVDTQYSYNSRSAMATGDVDGDGLHEIFAAVGTTLTRLDGVERRPVDTLQLGVGEACADLLYADLDNDGAAELLCLASTDYWTGTARILVLRASDLSLRHEFPQAAYGRSLAVGNVDTDPAQELVTSNGYVFDGATLVNQWLYGPGFGMDVDTGDLDGDGVEEIVAALDWDFVRAYSATLTTPLWEVPRFDLDSLLVADVAGDARPEILVGDGQSGGFTIYRYNTATYAVDVVDQIDSQASGTTAIGVGDVDNDGQREIIWGSGASSTGPDVLIVAGFNPALAVEWRNDDPIQLDGPFKGGELAGSAVASRAPLFFSVRTNSGYDGVRLVRMPADGGALEISPVINTNWSGVGALAVVDYDHDGTDEAFLASSAYYDGTFSVYDFFADVSEWSSGNQSQSSAADVTHADLTGDGRAELIGLTTSGVVSVHDVYQQTLFWQSTTLNGGRRVFAADVNGDGESEIVAVTPLAVYVYRRNPPPTRFVQAAIYQSTRDIIDAAVGDTDGDGDAEIVLAVGYSYTSMPSDVVTLDGNLQSLGSFTLQWPVQTIDIEPSMTPRKNLLIGRMTGPYYEAQILAIVDARTGGIVFESPPLIGGVQPGSVHYVTLPGETRERMSIGTSAGMYLTR